MTSEREALLSAVEAYYDGRLREHGTTARGVDWNSPESQRVRFAQLIRLLDTGGRFSINDFGCGYGALARFLDGLGLDFAYHGFDISGAMVTAAREHVRDLENCAFTSDLAELPVSDYTVASGLFNVKLDASEHSWEEYLWDTVALLDAHSSVAFAFNALTAHADADRMRPDLFYADPAHVLERCLVSFSRNVAVVHDYGLYEFTVVVRRAAVSGLG
jgi:SAM-dependent methyltransferase